MFLLGQVKGQFKSNITQNIRLRGLMLFFVFVLFFFMLTILGIKANVYDLSHQAIS